MGMHTELVLATRIKHDPAVVDVLKHMLGGGEKPEKLPEHPLFSTPRWAYMLQCSSYYFVPRATRLFEYDDIGGYWVLITRSDFKNYDDEVKHFIDWVRPHLAAPCGTMFGYSRYEEDEEPTVYYADEAPQ